MRRHCIAAFSAGSSATMQIQPRNHCPGKYPRAKSDTDAFHGPPLYPVPNVLEQIFSGVSATRNCVVRGSNAFSHSICHNRPQLGDLVKSIFRRCQLFRHRCPHVLALLEQGCIFCAGFTVMRGASECDANHLATEMVYSIFRCTRHFSEGVFSHVGSCCGAKGALSCAGGGG